MKFLQTLSLVGWLCLLPVTSTAAETEAPLPSNSLYRMDAMFTDQTGTPFKLSERRGHPQLVAMFYTSCRYVCPLIVDSAKRVEHALTASERSQLDILLVSLDPARDDTEALKSVFDKRSLDATRWTLARTETPHVRSLAALLGVRYRALADGEFNHTSVLVLLDGEGRKIASTDKLGSTPDPAFLTAVRGATCVTAECLDNTLAPETNPSHGR